MAFKVRKLDYRPWPVSVKFRECNETTGEVTEAPQVFIGHFVPFSEADIKRQRLEIFGDELDAGYKASLATMPSAEYAEKETQFFAGLMSGWSEVRDESGAEMPYSAAALRELTTGPDGPVVRRALNDAVVEIRFGLAPAKNSGASPAPGPSPAAVEAAPAN